ncbi:MAG: hypothetical protein M0T70_02795 [Geobacteraceae bacterium]|nr:hypothetical protein [Geobacteraceae bacterium]
MIDCATVIITREGFEITAYAENGEVVKEQYMHNGKVWDCVSGNFDDEPLVNNDWELLCGITSFYDNAGNLANAIRKQKEN